MRVTLKASNEVPLSVAAVDFIHVSMDKHRQATEKIQARMLEIFVLLWFMFQW